MSRRIWAEPILGLDAGFYLFVLPFLGRAYALLVVVSLIGVVASLLEVLAAHPRGKAPLRIGHGARRAGRGSLLLAGVAAGGMLLARYYLLYSEWGVVAGPGWTDVHVRLPGYGLVAVATLGLAAAPLVPSLARRMQWALGQGRQRLEVGPIGTAWIAIGAVWLLGLVALPQPGAIPRGRAERDHLRAALYRP